MGTNVLQGQILSRDETGSRYIRSDTDRTPSPSPMAPTLPQATSSALRGTEINLNGYIDDSPAMVHHNRAHGLHPRPGSSHRHRAVFKNRTDHRLDHSAPVPPGMGHPIIPTGNSHGSSHRRSRPETTHQKAVNMNRKMRIDHILHKQMQDQHYLIRKEDKLNKRSFGYMAMRRIQELPNGYDTEDENSWGPGGLVPNPGEKEDFGEAALRHKKVLDRALRRLSREDGNGRFPSLVRGYRKRKRKDWDYENGGERSSRKSGNQPGRHDPSDGRDPNGERQEGLDDLDLDLLGESRDDERMEDDIDEESVAAEGSIGDGDDATEDDMTHEQ